MFSKLSVHASLYRGTLSFSLSLSTVTRSFFYHRMNSHSLRICLLNALNIVVSFQESWEFALKLAFPRADLALAKNAAQSRGTGERKRGGRVRIIVQSSPDHKKKESGNLKRRLNKRCAVLESSLSLFLFLSLSFLDKKKSLFYNL